MKKAKRNVNCSKFKLSLPPGQPYTGKKLKAVRRRPAARLHPVFFALFDVLGLSLKRLLCSVCSVLLFSLNAGAQNLAPNPSFENFNACPTAVSQIAEPLVSPTVLDWHRPTWASTDYFNSCSTGTVSVPDNAFGSQQARTGNAYVGFYSEEYREYIEGRLLAPLAANHRYYVSFWLNLSDGDYTGRAVDQFGAYFSADSIYNPLTTEFLPVVPQVVSPVGQVYKDRINWEAVSGTFTAAGAERWVTLGNFTSQANLNIETVPSMWPGQAYYYMDDVCVLDLDSTVPQNIVIHDTLVCPGVSVDLRGRRGYTEYIWDDGSTGMSRSIERSGSFWVRTIDKANCALYIDSFYVTILSSNVKISPDDTSICIGDTIKLVASGGVTYHWKDADWMFAQGAEATVWPRAQTTFSVTAIDALNGCLFEAQATVRVNPLPMVNAGKDINLAYGESTHLNGQASGTFMWYYDVGNPYILRPEVRPSRTTTYYLRATSADGCTAIDSVVVYVIDIRVPNAFSPNGDGLNDVFRLFRTADDGVGPFGFSIFNRWGESVYSSSDFKGGWDGTYNNKPADPGSYFYYIKYYIGSKEYVLKGEVLLIR
ncbi:gliding motility-associated C-terminal domain-containing protein [Taibaiella chishuiensis]|uniref:Gliding motility-associated-like protein n=1 Tax=Taibaiella chishuiensis TaxID=1434707 RepID=A0A2P8CT30_9BACT|nr:gliding motility-associated C-terminal domain-containing protein [Taibaiella chishuiensis]PSK88124.1 gliding motility-associated-like protein [Taibaiella chishuiensis]